MDMSSTMQMGGAPSDSPLNSTGFDLTNSTDAATFLGEILDDTVFQVDGNRYAKNFWYGIVVVIGLFAVGNVAQNVTLRMRFVHFYNVGMVTDVQ
jgi:ferric-chelate reductase